MAAAFCVPVVWSSQCCSAINSVDFARMLAASWGVASIASHTLANAVTVELALLGMVLTLFIQYIFKPVFGYLYVVLGGVLGFLLKAVQHIHSVNY